MYEDGGHFFLEKKSFWHAVPSLWFFSIFFSHALIGAVYHISKNFNKEIGLGSPLVMVAVTVVVGRIG